ncbi:MAG: tRNA (adenosine(37)-N6)-threonylcarbamoyltransferase complex dimerization subunit type 1 TsaB [Pseudomonadota bacterium]
MILGIDTSAGQCAVALLAGGRVAASAAETLSRGHAERLFPMIETVLERAGIGPSGLGRIAVCTGPGSFTGLRVGVAAARGLALGRGVPAIGVTRLEAVAAGVVRPLRPPAPSGREDHGGSRPRRLEDKVGWAETRPVAVALAGRGSVFLQRFGPDLAPLAPPAVVHPETLSAVENRDVRLGDGWAVAGLAAELAPEGLADPASVAAIAAGRAPGALPAPLYLREADADLPSEAPPVLLD